MAPISNHPCHQGISWWKVNWQSDTFQCVHCQVMNWERVTIYIISDPLIVINFIHGVLNDYLGKTMIIFCSYCTPKIFPNPSGADRMWKQNTNFQFHVWSTYLVMTCFLYLIRYLKDFSFVIICKFIFIIASVRKQWK